MPVKANIDTDSIFRFFLPEGPGLKYKRLAQGIEESIRNGVLRQESSCRHIASSRTSSV